MTDLRPGQVGLLAGPGPAEAEAVEAAVRVGPGEAEGARPAGGALHALHVGLAGAVAVGVTAAVALLVALVLQGARRVVTIPHLMNTYFRHYFCNKGNKIWWKKGNQITVLVHGSLLGPQYLMGYLLTLVSEHWQVTCIIVGLIGLTKKI